MRWRLCELSGHFRGRLHAGHGCAAEQLRTEAELTGRVLVVDETRQSGGVSEGVIAALIDAGYRGRIARVTSADSFIPLGDAAAHVLVSEADIERAARRLLG